MDLILGISYDKSKKCTILKKHIIFFKAENFTMCNQDLHSKEVMSHAKVYQRNVSFLHDYNYYSHTLL